MVTIHPISETIPPGRDIVQPEIDPDLVSSLPEHLNPEVEQPEVEIGRASCRERVSSPV